MHEMTIVPTLWTIARQVLASHHVTHGTVRKYSFSLSFFRKPHWQFPDSSTEERFLSVLKNNVSDTRGTELLLQEIFLGFLQVFLFVQFLGISELMFLNPSNGTVFSYDSREIQNSLTKTTLQ